MLLPLNDNLEIAEHINRFTESFFPLEIGNKYLSYFKIIDSQIHADSYWPGEQILLIYSDKEKYPNQSRRLSEIFNNSQYKELKVLLEQKTEDEEELNKKIENLTSSIQQLEITENAFKEENVELHKTIEDKQARVNSLKAEKEELYAKLQKENETIISKLQSAEQKLSESETKKTELKKQLTDQAQHLNQQIEKINELNTQLNSKNEQIEMQKARLQEYESFKQSMNEYVENTRSYTMACNEENDAQKEKAKSFLLALSNTKIFRLAHYLTRLVQQFIKGSLSDKGNFIKWLFGDKNQKNHKYNPLYTAMDLIDYKRVLLDAPSLNSVETSNLYKEDRFELIDKDGELEKEYTKQDVIILSIIDYDFRFQRPQHIAKRIAERGHRVFYVNANFKDCYGNKKITDNLYQITLEPSGNIYSNDFSIDMSKIMNQLDEMINKACIAEAVVLVDYPN